MNIRAIGVAKLPFSRVIRLAVAVAFLMLSSLRFWHSENLIVWKLSILTSEFGHWVAPIAFALGVFVFLIDRTREGRTIGVLCVSATALFLSPLFQFATGADLWERQLGEAFGDSTRPAPMLGLRGLFASSHTAPVQIERPPKELTYETEAGEKLPLLFYATEKSTRAPWLLVVHGGGWDSGDRYQLPELNSVLAAQGIAVISIDYRLAPKWVWPAPREDVFHAVRFIKDHAAELRVDADRWAILGRSAGGQIAEAVAYQAEDRTLKGCVALYSPSDMLFAYKYGREDDILNSRVLLREYMGGEPSTKSESYHDASPIFFVNSKSPPTLLFHGPRDPLVWVRHSERLLGKLRENGVKSALIEIPWATHAFDYSLAGPGGRLSTAAIEYFLKAVFQ